MKKEGFGSFELSGKTGLIKRRQLDHGQVPLAFEYEEDASEKETTISLRDDFKMLLNPLYLSDSWRLYASGTSLYVQYASGTSWVNSTQFLGS